MERREPREARNLGEGTHSYVLGMCVFLYFWASVCTGGSVYVSGDCVWSEGKLCV